MINFVFYNSKKNYMIKRYILLIITLLPVGFLNSQTRQAEALRLFNAEKYAEAAEIYASIIESNNRDIPLNYYYGVSLYHINKDIDEAIRRLKFSSTRPVSPDVHYYLGKLYQQVYEMELAADHFDKFLTLSKLPSSKTKDAEKTMEDCLSAVRLINKYFDIQVLKKDTVNKNAILNNINLSKDAGELMLSQSFFVTGVDRNQVIFKTERGNEVFFPMQERDDSWNIYKIIKLLDSWSEPELLNEPINSAYDDLYPFLLIDGVTLYFSSNRPGGMGGFDIYQSYFDPETGTFSDPANLGPPFNSPDDDFLLVPDEYSGKAWFVTNRGVEKEKNIVVEIVWDDTVIKNNTENIHQLKHIASLPTSENISGRTAQQFRQNDTEIMTKSENQIFFIINDTLSYSRTEQFHSTEALNMFKAGYDAEQRKIIFISHLDKKREAFSQSYDLNEKNSLYNEIVQLERQTYGMVENINEKYISARRLELEKISQLKKDGNYYPKSAPKQLAEPTPTLLAEEKTIYHPENDTTESDTDENDQYFDYQENNDETISQLDNPENNVQNLEYKIQIGVFRNPPNKEALDKIPTISQSETDSDGLTKYYSGSWKKFEEALSMVNTVRAAGFPGAFVIAFLDGERISLENAKKIE